MTMPLNRRRIAMPLSLIALLLPAASLLQAPAAGARPHASGGCANAGLVPTRARREAVKRAVVCLIDQQRVSRGLPPLRESSDLDLSAQRASNWMVRSGSFDHGRWTARMSAAGFRYSIAGEDIGTGYYTARQMVAGWMASTGHCRVILDPRFSRVGSGVVNRHVAGYSDGGATWAEDFALPRGVRAPSSDFGPAGGCPYR